MSDYRLPSHLTLRAGSLLVGSLLLAGSAWADGVNVQCNEPKSEWRTQMELQRKLTEQGWKVRKVKTDQGCYEVYGFDNTGKRIEIYFNPKTFEKVAEVEQEQ